MVQLARAIVVGPIARLELIPEGDTQSADNAPSDALIEAQIPAQQFHEMGLREGRTEDRPLLDVFASLVVERDSQKGIVIGHKGSVLREIGTAARAQLAALLGTPVHLDLKVKVLKDWQRNAKYLNRLGF